MTSRLHELLDTAADGVVPDDIAHRAISRARARRRHRVELVAVIVATVLVVAPAGWVITQRSLDRAQTTPVVGSSVLPAQLPSARGLPLLADAPMSSASAAYLDDGFVVAVNAASGSGAIIYPNFTWEQGQLADWDFPSHAYLSPDGTKLLIFGSSELLVDIPANTTERLPIGVDQRSPQGDSIQAAWAPDSKAFACMCSTSGSPDRTQFRIFDVEDPSQPNVELWGSSVVPVQLSWGTNGLALAVNQACNDPLCSFPKWSLVANPGAPGLSNDLHGALPLGSAELLALSQSAARQGQVLYVNKPGIAPGACFIGEPPATPPHQPVASQGLMPVVYAEGECDPVSVGAAGDGFVMIMPSGSIVAVNKIGGTSNVSQLPAGATSASFAAELVG